MTNTIMCGIVPKRPEVKQIQVFETNIKEGQKFKITKTITKQQLK